MPATLTEVRAVLLGIVRTGDDHTIRQAALLLCLSGGPDTIRHLAVEMGVVKAVVTRAVDRLVADDYAERLPDPSDGRSVLVRLTESGRKFAGRFRG